jgi:N utilization substance protein A
MEVIVNEDQLSLAIGKRGQNVRLATKLVGWNIDIRSEEEIKREVAQQMGALIASGEPVPLEALQGVTAATTAALAEHGINDIATLASTTIDDLVEYLDISLDEAEQILSSAQAVMAARDASQPGDEEGEAGTEATEGASMEASSAGETETSQTDASDLSGELRSVEQHAVSAEFDPSVEAGEVEPSEEMIAAGYDEAVERGTPFSAEDNILAGESADPVAMTEIEPMSPDELLLQGAGRDLRPDTITPSPDITSTEAAVFETSGALMDESERAETDDMFDDEDDSSLSPTADLGGEASAPEIQGGSSFASEDAEASAPGGNAADNEPNDASGSDTL